MLKSALAMLFDPAVDKPLAPNRAGLDCEGTKLVAHRSPIVQARALPAQSDHCDGIRKTEFIMASNRKQGEGGGAPQRRAPDWANGLKQLYDSVVEEDLPDTFKDLLDRLDGIDSARNAGGSGNASPSPDGGGARQ